MLFFFPLFPFFFLLFLPFFLDGDMSLGPSYGVYISHLVLFARICDNHSDVIYTFEIMFLTSMTVIS